MSNEYMVFGPPGTGKTQYLSNQIGSALKHGTVMVASFTRTAAKEIAARVRSVVGEDEGGVKCGTLHSFAFKALGNPPIAEVTKGALADFGEFAPGYALSGGMKVNLDEGIADQPEGSVGDALLMEYQRLRALCTPREIWDGDILQFAREWEIWKKKNKLLDFSDLIETCLNDKVFPFPSYSTGFFDEVQDFTRLEMKLMNLWGVTMQRVVYVGDDDQCIFSFCGASPDAFVEREVEPGRRIVLKQSYRTPRAIHSFAEQWVRKLSYREEKEFAPRDAEGSIERSSATWRRPTAMVEDLQRWLSENEGTAMILAACSYMLTPVIDELRAAGVPFWNPYRTTRGDWNPLNRGGTSAFSRVLSLIDTDRWTYGDLKKWTSAVRAEALMPGAKAAIQKISPALDNTFVLSNELEQWLGYKWDPDFPSTRWLKRNLVPSQEKAFDFPIRIIETHGTKFVDGRPRVIIGTIHSVKGGEADRVYLFPDLSNNGWREFHGDAGMRDRAIRQFYVGITRARSDLVLCNSNSSKAVQL